VWPGEWYDASPFPNRYLVGTKREAFHTGADLNLPHNADAAMPVHAVASGLVVFAGSIDVWGNVVVIQHDPLERTGQVVFSRYAHMNEIYVKRGHRVSRGWNIAKIGNANGTLSEHLHFDISPTFVLQDKPGHWPGLRMSEMCHYVDPKEFILANRPPVRAGYDNDGQLAEYNVYLQDMLRRKKSPLVS
jgi:murein DD-endopeptidase MepM/ murein hydrolase activator NlpD